MAQTHHKVKQTPYEGPQTIEEFLKQLKDWYNDPKTGFQALYDRIIDHLVPFPSDTPPTFQYNWGKTPDVSNIDRLCNFFQAWYDLYDKEEIYTPGKRGYDPSSSIYNGLDYIVKFSWLSYENEYGMVFVTSGLGRQMTEDFTRLQGKQMDNPKSSKLAKVWVNELGPEKMRDFEPKEYATTNEFFVRELKDASISRPIAPDKDGSVVVAASADCVINMIVDKLTEVTPIPVKTVTMNINELLGGSPDKPNPYASRFVGGTAVSCILMPDMYHWYHAPVEGKVVEANDQVGNIYYGMQDFPGLLNKGNVGYGYDYGMFEDFRRGYLIIDTKTDEYDYGYVGMVPVGLNSIGTVIFSKAKKDFTKATRENPIPVAKGEKIGYFQYGGSLNILLFEPQVFPALQLLQGQRIGLLEEKNSARTLGIFSSLWRRPSRRDRF